MAAMLASTLAAADPDVSGRWAGSFAAIGPDGVEQGAQPANMILKQSGSQVTGTAGPENEQWPIQKGKMEGAKLTVEVKSPDDELYQCALTLTGGNLKGECTVQGNGQTGKGKVEFARAK